MKLENRRLSLCDDLLPLPLSTHVGQYFQLVSIAFLVHPHRIPLSSGSAKRVVGQIIGGLAPG